MYKQCFAHQPCTKRKITGKTKIKTVEKNVSFLTKRWNRGSALCYRRGRHTATKPQMTKLKEEEKRKTCTHRSWIHPTPRDFRSSGYLVVSGEFHCHSSLAFVASAAEKNSETRKDTIISVFDKKITTMTIKATLYAISSALDSTQPSKLIQRIVFWWLI